jgi:hypothetical protein
MKVFVTFLILIILIAGVFAINPNTPYVAPTITDSNTMGAFLVTEWAFGSIDLAFLILSIIVCVIMIKYALPMSIIAVSVMSLATVFAFGFSSIFAWGFLIIGIITISLLVVLNILYKSSY